MLGMESCGAETNRKKVPVVLFEGVALSVTCTEKLKEPEAVGVPDSKPVWLSVTPAGREPDVTCQVNVPVPSIARSWKLNGEFKVTMSDVVVIENGRKSAG